VTAKAASACQIWNRSQVTTSGDSATRRRRKPPRAAVSAPATNSANHGQNGQRASSSAASPPAKRQFTGENVHASEGVSSMKVLAEGSAGIQNR
jgi:hypothetical protein